MTDPFGYQFSIDHETSSSHGLSSTRGKSLGKKLP
jgi:hypothetical protein